MAGRLPARLAGSLAWPVAWPGLVEAGLVRPGRAWAPGLAWLAAGNRGPQLPSFTQLCIIQISKETDKKLCLVDDDYVLLDYYYCLV